MGYAAYGIAPGCHADLGVGVLGGVAGIADARWTAPVTGLYDLAVPIGGTTASEGGGVDNYNAPQSGLNINGVAQTGTYNANTNVYTWRLDDIGLSQGAIVSAYVFGGAVGHDTQTIFTVTSVAGAPEMSTIGTVALMIGAGWIGLRRRQII